MGRVYFCDLLGAAGGCLLLAPFLNNFGGPGTILASAVLALIVSFTLSAAVGVPLWLKIAFTVLLIAPAGFVMGMAFPTGLDRLERWHKPSVRWAWSINAASSVLGSVGALVSAIYTGLFQTMLLGGLFYAGALLVVARRSRE